MTPPRVRLRDRIDHFARSRPSLLAIMVFALAIFLFTGLLMLPFAQAGPGSASFLEALFTAASAVCVTGLSIVDTATYWTVFGQIIIALGIQIGGLGIMTLSSVLALAVSRRIGFTQRILFASETRSALGDVGNLLKAVILTSFTAELLLFFALLPSIVPHAGSILRGSGFALFTAISVFNNAGFTIMQTDLAAAVGNWGVCVPIIAGAMAGAIGYPVIRDLSQNWRTPRKLTIHTKLTLSAFGIIWVVGVVGIAAFEWHGAFAELDLNSKTLASFFHSSSARSLGLSTVDIAHMSEATWFFLMILMFIGAGSASTGGGIKVTTFAVLFLAIVAEARGDRDTEVFGRRLPPPAIRLAISVTFLGMFLVAGASLLIVHISGQPLANVMFETISAFATCGLTTGIIPDLPTAAQAILVALMYFGRVGTATFAAALALRSRRRVIRYPENQPLIG